MSITALWQTADLSSRLLGFLRSAYYFSEVTGPVSLFRATRTRHMESHRTVTPPAKGPGPSRLKRSNRARRIRKFGVSPATKRVLCIASRGGHWIQMKRLLPALEGSQPIFVSTHPGYRKEVGDKKFYSVLDSSRWNKFRLLITAIQVFWIVWRERPDSVISTGAAPGLFGIIFGKLFGCKTLWLDSIANAEQLSMSGQIASRFSDLHLTQWKQLAGESNSIFKGTVVY